MRRRRSYDDVSPILPAPAATAQVDAFLADFLDTTWIADKPLRAVLIPAGTNVSGFPP